jgi:hypothetical protein
MGIAAAPLEFLVGASINDIYYVHERGLPGTRIRKPASVVRTHLPKLDSCPVEPCSY